MKRIPFTLFVFLIVTQLLSAQCDHPDYDALMELYHGTDGNKWTNNDGWRLGAIGDSCEPCEWYGVNCSGDRVIQLLLGENNLMGTIPDIQVTNLSHLFLSNNLLIGEIPDFSGLSGLEYLDLSHNSMVGEIPDFQSLPQLKRLALNNNFLTGELVDFTNLPVLQSLWLGDNLLEGRILDFSNLHYLKSLSVHVNKLEGPLVNFTNLSRLESFNCESNFLSGPIPHFEKCRFLKYINLSSNPINEIIPDFVNLLNLERFYCRSADLHGRFPPFSKNKNLIQIDVSNNKLTGFIPDFSSYGEMQYVKADNNDLEGCYQPFEMVQVFIEGASSYNGNSRMPYFGNIFRAEGDQIGAPCGIPGFEGYNAYINEDCKCVIEECNKTHPDLDALIEIYHNTGGENWINNFGWKAAAEGYRCFPCDETFGNLYGVTCENNRVVCLDLDGLETCDFNGFGGNNLTGYWPKVNLYYLRFLILDDNSLEGSIPDVSTMPFLQELRVSNNNLTGEIPSFYNNRELTTLRLSYNNLFGSLPNEKFTDNIKFLTVAENNLSGCFSDWMCELELFDALGNKRMAWEGDFEMFCNGTSQESAPCIDDFANPGLIRDCYCCEIPEQPDEQHLCIQSIYPNPAASDLFITNLSEGRECLIYDTRGQLVLKQRLHLNKLDVSSLIKGVYFLTYENLNYENVTVKFMKL